MRDTPRAGDSPVIYDGVVIFMRGTLSAGIEALLARHGCQLQRTLPADLTPTLGYQVMNADRLGIPAEKAECASWRVNDAHQFNLPHGFVLLATVPPPPERPGGWSMLLMAYDARDGNGTRLLGAWWLGPDFPAEPLKAFSQFVGRFGCRMRIPGTESVFFLGAPGEIPPQPAGRVKDVELHAIRQQREPAEPPSWAWCFGIDVPKHRAYLEAMEAGVRKRKPVG